MAQTDNSFLTDKVMLRARHLPEREKLTVLDCYAGTGLVWRHVKNITGRDIQILGIDIRDDVGFVLPGDNRAYLTGLDLGRFDVIDLDAYGIPYEQLKIVFDRGYTGIVFITFIQSVFGALPRAMLLDLGYPEEMVEKIPTVFYRDGWGKFLCWLAWRGIRTVCHRSRKQKHYAMINCAAGCGVGYGSRAGGSLADPS